MKKNPKKCLVVIISSVFIIISAMIILLTAFVLTRKQADEQYWICQTDYTEITYAGGFYYYKSEANNDYLYRADEKGRNRQCIATQVPKEIYVMGDWVYFTNLSDGSKLYRVRTSGSELEMVCDERITRFFPVEDQFYCLSESSNGDKVFVCTSGGETKTVYEGECYWISTDGTFLYLKQMNTEEQTQYRTVVMDRTGEIKEEYETCFRNLIPTERYLYYSEGQEITRLDKNTGKKISIQIPDLTGNDERVFRYAVWDGKIYVLFLDKKGGGESYQFFQFMDSTEMFEELCEETKLSGDMYFWERMSYIYPVNGKIFYKNFVADGKGELWYMLDLSGGVPTVFEEMEEPAAVDTSLTGDFFYEGYRGGFLKPDILYEGEEEDENGYVRGTSIVLPKISGDIAAADCINLKIREDAEKFYEEQKVYHEGIKWDEDDEVNRSDGLFSCDYAYADEKYVSIVYRKELWTNDLDYGTREYMTRLYSSDTGEELQMADLFAVKWEEVSLRFSWLLRKTEQYFSLFLNNLSLEDMYMRVYFCLTDSGVDIVLVDDMRTFKEYHFVISYKELEDIWYK